MRKLMSGLTLVGVVGGVAVGVRAQQYTVVDLGPVQTSSPISYYGYGENSLGVAVGSTSTLTPAEEFSNGVATSLGTLGGSGSSIAYGLNTSGLAVGSSTLPSGTAQGFTYTTATGMVAIGSLGAGTFASSLHAVNDSGEAVGASVAASGGYNQIITYTTAGGISAVGALSSAGASFGYGINAAGAVVGAGIASNGQNHAVVDIPGVTTGLEDIGTLGGTSSTAFQINASDEVVGYSATASGNLDAYDWTPTGGMVDLGQFAAGDTATTVEALNDAGLIVGYAGGGIGGPTSAWIYTPGSGYADLNTEIGTQYSNTNGVAGWELQRAYAINDAGDIVGYGVYEGQTGSAKSVFELIPTAVPEPASLSLLALGGLATLGRRRSRLFPTH